MVGEILTSSGAQEDKNNDRYCDRCPFLFNAMINNLDLRELEIPGRQYTWANNLQAPTLEKLDRVLVSTYWEFKYPLVTVKVLPRIISNHSPLLLNMGMSSQHTSHMFKFELGWLLKDGFYDLVTDICQREGKGSTSLEICQNKIRSLRKYLGGWAKNQNGAYKKEKKELASKIDELDKKVEHTMLLPQEVDLRHCLKVRLIQLLLEEEVKWYQCSKSDKLLQGDNNTKYFYLVANGKHRKHTYFSVGR
jgi:hypothetical protein